MHTYLGSVAYTNIHSFTFRRASLTLKHATFILTSQYSSGMNLISGEGRNYYSLYYETSSFLVCMSIDRLFLRK